MRRKGEGKGELCSILKESGGKRLCEKNGSALPEEFVDLNHSGRPKGKLEKGGMLVLNGKTLGGYARQP